MILILDSGHFINPEWMMLHASRGIESDGLKTFMRWTVILSDIFIYIPAAVFFASFKKVSSLCLSLVLLSYFGNPFVAACLVTN
jgi:hypothetical protein